MCSPDVAQPSATIRNPSATVCKCPREGLMAVPLGSAAFGSFKRRVASFCVAGVALRDILVLCDRRHTFFASFSKDEVHFSWQAQHFGDLHHHFAWQAQHFRRVVLCVFCESHCQGCVKWRQRANYVAGVAFYDTLHSTLYT